MKVRTRNFKVVGEAVCNDGSMVKVVGGNVRYFARHNQAVNWADRRSDNYKSRNVPRPERQVAITVYSGENFDTMKYRTY